MNPLGFESGMRHITPSGEDLNRSFPGNANGSLGERIAHTILTRSPRPTPDLVVDFHNDWTDSMPYVLVDRDPGKAHQNPIAMRCTRRGRRHVRDRGRGGAAPEPVVQPGAARYPRAHV
ncbi:MAG: succinylglutamate desuccinylase/aspartoacylase family protein [Haliea sp.]|nr:succinylglutamate desuccinylase/aspartoacylase family protein [Haliea sp.]